MIKDMKFSIFLLLLQVIFIFMYGFFVEYDEVAGPKTNQSSAEDNRQFEILYPMFQDVHVMIFVGFGFLMTFLKRYGYGAVGFNLLLAAFVIQWAILMRGSLTAESKIHLSVETIMNADFAAGAVLISFGAVLGVLSPIQLLVMALLEVAVYAVNEYIIVEHLHINDIGGSLIIHSFGAYFGLAVSVMHWKKRLVDNQKEESVYHSDMFAMIGTLFLWLFWPSFNGALAASHSVVAQRCVTNTLYSIVASTIASFAISSIIDKKGKLSMVHVQNSSLAGGVAAGAVANLATGPMGALLIGTCAGIISVAGYKYVTPTFARAFHIHDTCGVHNLHGMPGVMSAFIAVVMARFMSPTTFSPEELAIVYPNVKDGNFQHQANMQMAGLAVTLGTSIVGGVLTGLVLRAPFIDSADENNLFEDSKYWITDESDRDSPEPMNETAIPLAPSNGETVAEE
ncbi:ammonium transporter Rh type A-like [Styela clava]